MPWKQTAGYEQERDRLVSLLPNDGESFSPSDHRFGKVLAILIFLAFPIALFIIFTIGRVTH